MTSAPARVVTSGMSWRSGDGEYPDTPVTSWGARPSATKDPDSESTTSTLVAWVEQSTPATSGLIGAAPG